MRGDTEEWTKAFLDQVLEQFEDIDLKPSVEAFVKSGDKGVYDFRAFKGSKRRASRDAVKRLHAAVSGNASASSASCW